MKHGFHSALRAILISVFAFLAAGRVNAQISQPPPCDGPLTIYFSVNYRTCEGNLANAKVIPNCGTLPFSYQWSNGTISSEILNVTPGTYTATVTDAKGLKAVGSVTVLPPAATPLNLTASVTGLGCTGIGTGSAVLTVTGGTQPYDARWRKVGTFAYSSQTNISSPFPITGLTAGTYMVIVQDARTCKDTVFIDIKQGLIVTSAVSASNCSGSNVRITASGGTAPYSVKWTGGAPLTNVTFPKDFPNVAAGTYTFTVTDVTGCSGTTSAVVTQVPVFTISATSTAVTCANSQAGTISVNLATPGTAPYKIQLNGGPQQNVTAFPFVFSNLTAGNYNIRVTDASGCTSNTSVEVETALDVVLTVKPPAQPLCGGSDVVVTLANSGTAPYTVSWTGVNGFTGTATVQNFPFTIPNVPPGLITVDVKDATGCTGSETGTSVGNPVMQIQATTTAPTCQNLSGGTITVSFITPGTAPFTISLNGGPAQPFTGNFTYNNVTPGTYLVTVTDKNGCTATTTAKVETALDVVLTVNPPAQALCGGSDIVVTLANTGTAPYTVTWTGVNGFTGTATVQNFPYTIANVPPGLITVHVKDATGCTGAETGTSIGNPVMQIQATTTAPTCQNLSAGTITVTFITPGTAPFTISLNGGASQPFTGNFTYNNLTAGTYLVTVTDKNGCTATTTAKVETALDVVLTINPPAQPLCGGSDVVVTLANTGTAPYVISWTGVNGFSGSDTIQGFPYTISNVPPGLITVNVKDATGCTGSETGTSVGNPVMQIQATTTAPTCLNLSGGTITVTFITPGTAPFTISLNGGASQPFTGNFTYNNLTAGTYLVTVTDKNGCTATTTAKVETALDVVLTINPPAQPLCGGSDVVVTLANTGTAPYVISWTGVNGFAGTDTIPGFPYTIANVPPGPITVNVKDATGCTGAETGISVGTPVMQIKATKIIATTCANPQGGAFTIEFITPGTPAYTIAVASTNGFTFSGAFSGTATFNNLSAGTYTVTVTDKNGCTATTTVKIETPLDVVLTPQVASNPLCKGADLKIDINGNPGTAPYTIQWSSPNSSGQVTGVAVPYTLFNIPPGLYSVTVTDATGCTGTETTTVTGPQPMQIAATGTQVTCQNGQDGTVTVTMTFPGTAPYTIQWTGSGSAQPATFPFTINNLTPGAYCITVTDANNCTATTCTKVETAIDVTLTPQPAANATCGGQDVVINIAGFQGKPPYQVSWSGANGQFLGTATVTTFPLTVSNVPPGQFCVTVTDADSCIGTECVTVAGNPVMLIKATTTAVTCDNAQAGSIQITFTVPGTAPYTVQWTGGPATPQPFTSPFILSNLAAGDYCVTVTDANGCTASTCATVETALDVVLNPIPPANAACGGQDVVVTITGSQLGTPPYVVSWSGANGNFTGTATATTLPFTIPNAPPGTFCVTVTDALGCTGSECTTITGNPVMLISATSTAVTCVDSLAGTITVSFVVPGKAPYTIAWSGPVSGGPQAATLPFTIQNLKSGDYCVTVTDANGCTATTCVKVETALDVVLNPIPPANPLCGGQDVVIDISGNQGTAPYTVTWSGTGGFGGTTTTATLTYTVANVPPGGFCVTVTDANGCTGTECTTVTGAPVMLIAATTTAVTCADSLAGTITVSFLVPGKSPYTIAWSGPSNGGSQGATLPFTISNLPHGNYVITVTDANGCTATTTAKVETALDVVLNPIPPANAACGGQDVVVNITGTQGTPPYVITWSGAGGSFPGTATVNNLPFTIPNVPPGVFFVTVTDANGCTGTERTTVTGDPVMLIQAVATGVTCQDSLAGAIAVSFIVPGKAPYTIAWSGPVSGGPQAVVLSFTITGLKAGEYCITVTDANGCTATTCARVETAIDVVLTPTAASDPLCGGGNLIVDIKSGGVAPFKYNWTGPFGTSGTVDPATFPDTLKNVPPGQYAVTVTDANGCTGTEVATVVGPPKMVIQTDSVTAISCFGGGADGMITVKMLVPGVGPYKIQWTNGPLVQNVSFPFKINGLTPGIYVITVTDSRGCTATASARIETALDVTLKPIAGTNFNCAGGSLVVNVANGGVPPFDIKWSGPVSGTKLDVTLPDTLVNLPPGEYTVTVTDASGCTGTETAVIGGDTMFQVAALGANLSCISTTADGKITVQLVHATKGPYIIQWPTGGPASISGNAFPYTIPNLTAGTFTVTVTDANGCTSEASATLTGGPPNVEIKAMSPMVACQDTSITLQVNNLLPSQTLSYVWTSSSPNVTITPANSANPVITTNTPGTYSLTLVAKNEFGCEQIVPVTIEFKKLESLVGFIFADLCNGLVVQFDNNTDDITGKWDFGDNTGSTENDPTHTYASPNMYMVTFVSDQDCVSPFDTMIQVLAVPAVEANFGFAVSDCFGDAEITFTDSTNFNSLPKNWLWKFDPPAQTSTLQNPVIKFTKEGVINAQLITTDVNGCADTMVLAVPVNIVTDSILQQFTFCVGDSIELNAVGAQPFDYNWTSTPPDPTLVSTDPTPIVKPTQATTYGLEITNGNCKVDFQAVATVKPTVTAAALPANINACDEDPVTLTLGTTNATTFIWSDSPTLSPVLGNGNSLTVVPEKNKTYYYLAANATDCPLAGQVKLNLGKLDIEPSPLDQVVCLGNDADLNIGNLDLEDTLTFVWTPALDPIANPSVQPTQNGTYSVIVTNQFGCADTIAFNLSVVDLSVTAEIIGKDTICVGETAQLLATATGNIQGFTYSWSPSSTLTGANTNNPTAKPEETTTYTVTVTPPDGLCPATDEVFLHVMTGQCVEPFIFVPKAFTPNGDAHNDYFIVRGVNITEVTFIVWDRWGEKVYETTDVNAQGWDGTYNGKELTPDAYAWYLRARCGNGQVYESKGNVTLLK